MAALIYKIFVLAVLFSGGYLLMRFGMLIDNKTSAIVAFGVMPAVAFVLWFLRYKGKRFS